MDVQGAEIDVLRGAERTLAHTRHLYTEYYEREMYAGQFTLSKLLPHLDGFEVVALFPSDVLLRNRRLERL